MENAELSQAEKEIIMRELKKKKLKKRLIIAVLIAVLLAGCFGAVWMAGYGMSKETISELKETINKLEETISSLITDPAVVNPVTPKIILDTVNKEFKEIGELATVEYLFTNAATYTDHKQIKEWNIPLTEKSFTLKWDGIIKAGVNIDEIQVEYVETDQKLLVTLPQAIILSYDIDENSVEVLDESKNKFNPITVEDKVKFDAETESDMKERAIDNGILDKAQKNAETIICGLLNANPTISGNCTIEFVYK